MKLLIGLVLLCGLHASTHAGPLAEALVETSTGVLDVDEARQHVFAARAAAIETGTDPLLLLGMAYIESSYRPASVSRRRCDENGCTRMTGVWPSRAPGDFQGPYFCGVLQVEARTWQACLAWRDDLIGTYRAAGHHLQWWLSTCRGDLTCALLGYGGGNRLIKKVENGYRGRPASYPQRCLHRRQKLVRALDRKTAS